MYCVEDGVGEGQFGLYVFEYDFFVQGDVVGIGDYLYQIVIDQVYCFQCVGIGQWFVVGGDECFDGVYQCIDVGIGGKEGIYG